LHFPLHYNRTPSTEYEIVNNGTITTDNTVKTTTTNTSTTTTSPIHIGLEFASFCCSTVLLPLTPAYNCLPHGTVPTRNTTETLPHITFFFHNNHCHHHHHITTAITTPHHITHATHPKSDRKDNESEQGIETSEWLGKEKGKQGKETEKTGWNDQEKPRKLRKNTGRGELQATIASH